MPYQDDDAPATKKDLRDLRQEIKQNFATKDDLKNFATKEDLKNFATKEDLKNFATKEDLKNFATKEDLHELKEGISGELQYFAKAIMTALEDMEKRLLKTMDDKDAASEQRMMMLMETWRSDVMDSTTDTFSLHDDRIKRLEIHTGLEPVPAV